MSNTQVGHSVLWILGKCPAPPPVDVVKPSSTCHTVTLHRDSDNHWSCQSECLSQTKHCRRYVCGAGAQVLSHPCLPQAKGFGHHQGALALFITDLLSSGVFRRSIYWTTHLLTSPPIQLLREVETQAIAAQQQISLVKTQQSSKQREMRMAELTRAELSSLPKDIDVYEGVGKMFVTTAVAMA